MPDKFDLVVVGSGPGGHAAAEKSARLGARTALIEKNKWGGTCTHVGCVPTKALLYCSKTFADLKKLKRIGITTGEVSFDFTAVKRHQAQIVRTSSLGVRKSLGDAGVELIEGEGHLHSSAEVGIVSGSGDQKVVQAKKIVIAWGSEPVGLSGIPFSARVLNSDGFLALEKLPESVIIIGAGNIGVEFATFLAELGTRVTLVELADQILPLEDSEAAAFLEGELKKIGIDTHTSTMMLSLSESADSIRVRAQRREGQIEMEAQYVVICAGRKPFFFERELEQFGIRYNRKGIETDEKLMTSIPGIYAAGDVTGGILLAHRAAQQGKALAEHLFGDGSFTYNEAAVPFVTYSHPNLARVGILERQATDLGIELEVARSEYGANILARAELSGTGFSKCLFHKDLLVGATIVGEAASELISPMALAIANCLKKADLKKWIIPHPTLSEILAIG